MTGNFSICRCICRPARRALSSLLQSFAPRAAGDVGAAAGQGAGRARAALAAGLGFQDGSRLAGSARGSTGATRALRSVTPSWAWWCKTGSGELRAGLRGFAACGTETPIPRPMGRGLQVEPGWWWPQGLMWASSGSGRQVYLGANYLQLPQTVTDCSEL